MTMFDDRRIICQRAANESRRLIGARRRSVVMAVAMFLFAIIVASGFKSGADTPATVDYLNTRPGVEYVGDEACRQCHLSKYESFKKTGMGRSMSRPRAGDGAFSKPATLHSEADGRTYSVFVENGKVFHREAQWDASHKPVFTETHEVAYSVGSGNHGQSYLIERGDQLFISPISFYTSTQKWDLSPGHESGLFRDFTRPAGGLCVSCHSGLAQPLSDNGNQYRQPAFRILSIGCERCHGPGALHVADRRAAKPLDGPVDRSIVNPRKLTSRLREDVCYQCHLSGDARIQRPGKSLLDFRPGTPLDDVVSIFLVPPTLKVGGFEALGQPEQIRMSRCRQADGSQLNCITCHDPHVSLSGAEAATYFNKKCMQCHAPVSQRFVQMHRAENSPAGNCVGCHMPKVAVTNIAHLALTNHRIPRSSADAETLSPPPDIDPQTNLIWATRPTDGRSSDLRTLALAFAQLAPNYRGYGERGFPLLDRAAREFPNDAEVQATYGQVLMVISPSNRARAKQAFERAIAAGSKSATLRRRLAQVLIDEGDAGAVALLREAIQLEPYNSAIYLQLARAYVVTGNRREAARTLEQALSFDPGNADARKLLSELPP